MDTFHRAVGRVTGFRRPAPDWIHGGDAPEWMAAAVCASSDPDVWFPERGGSIREAKAICRGCPSITPCLQFALEHVERYGVWGATSERERRKILGQRERSALQPCGTAAARRRHRRHGEAPCKICEDAEQARQFERAGRGAA